MRHPVISRPWQKIIIEAQSSSGGKFWSVYCTDTEVRIAYGSISASRARTIIVPSSVCAQSGRSVYEEAQMRLDQKLKSGYEFVREEEVVEGAPASNKVVPSKDSSESRKTEAPKPKSTDPYEAINSPVWF